MDFSVIELDQGSVDFRDELRWWLDEHVTDEMIETEWRNGDGHNREFHRALGAKGWAFPSLALNEGGANLDPLKCQILELELASRHVPTLTRETTAIVMPAIRRWMENPERDEVLLAAARGQICFCLGYTEPEAGSDLASVRTRAVRDGEDWVINGQKMFTTGAENCAYSFLLARTDPDVSKHKGLTTFLVPLDATGIEIREVKTLGGERTNMVYLDDVRVSDSHRLGPEGQGWMVVNGPLSEEHRLSESGSLALDEEPGEAGTGTSIVDFSAHILGVHEPAVRAAIEWAQTPDSDGTRPIDDPLIRQRFVEIQLGLVVSKLTPGPQGRVVAGDFFIRNAAELVDLLGPSAIVTRGEESAVGGAWAEYAHRFSQACAIYGGTTEVIRNLIADHFLGLGRKRTPPSATPTPRETDRRETT